MQDSLERYDKMSLRDVESTMHRATNELIAQVIVRSGAMHIRDVAAGEEAYYYSSGNFGPGYILIKGMVGRQKAFKFLVRQMALRLAELTRFEFFAGLVTGGVPPSMYLRDYVQELQEREIPWVYIRDTRKAGGTAEHITGIQDLATGGINPEIPLGSRGVVMEELTNFANSICNGAQVLRDTGYPCTTGVSLVHYASSSATEALRNTRLHLDCLITVPELLDVVEELEVFPQHLVDDYRRFLRGPADWMSHYGYEKKEHTR